MPFPLCRHGLQPGPRGVSGFPHQRPLHGVVPPVRGNICLVLLLVVGKAPAAAKDVDPVPDGDLFERVFGSFWLDSTSTSYLAMVIHPTAGYVRDCFVLVSSAPVGC